VAEGEFHESLNLAALWDLPVLFVCENNGYAMGTALQIHRGRNRHSRQGAGYNIAAEAVDGMDVVAVEAATRRALPSIRETGQALFPGMPDLSFPRAFHVRRPALPRQGGDRRVAREGADPALPGLAGGKRPDRARRCREIMADADAEIAEAVAFAEAGEWEPVEDLTKHVMGEERRAPPASRTHRRKPSRDHLSRGGQAGDRDAMIRRSACS
jgi:2-oxoisovalerate dehydrogenase E1 component